MRIGLLLPLFGVLLYSSSLFAVSPFSYMGSIEAEDLPRLSETDLAQKRQGDYFVPIPLANFDPDTGFGYGLRVFYYKNGTSEDPLFAHTPYLHRFFAQVFQTTTGAQYHAFNWDAPYLFRTPFRFRSTWVLADNPATNYFGNGGSSMGRLELPDALKKQLGRDNSKTFAQHQRSLNRSQANDQTYARYNDYQLRFYRWSFILERDFWSGRVRASGGFRLEKVTVNDYSNKSVMTEDGQERRMQTTKLREDYNANKIIGFRGGMDNVFRLALVYDTRDFEPDPNKGVFSEIVLEGSNKVIASDFDYFRVVMAPRFFYSPFPKHADFVLASRFIYYAQTGNVPFFSQVNISSTEGIYRGLGGRWTLRGYKQDRFVGKVGSALNLEARWNFADLEWKQQHFSFFMIPFVDYGRVFEDVESTTLDGWRSGHGLAFRIALNQATIGAFDYGVSEEDRGLHVNFHHQF